MGNFNPHVEREDDPDTLHFKDILQAVGLRQSVDFPTSVSWSTFDLIIT